LEQLIAHVVVTLVTYFVRLLVHLGESSVVLRTQVATTLPTSFALEPLLASKLKAHSAQIAVVKDLHSLLDYVGVEKLWKILFTIAFVDKDILVVHLRKDVRIPPISRGVRTLFFFFLVVFRLKIILVVVPALL
jgi:hypothetical protein